MYKEIWITWNNFTINVGFGDVVTGTFITWTSPTPLLPILDIGIRTYFYRATGDWIFYIQDPLTTTVDATTLLTRHATTINDLSTQVHFTTTNSRSTVPLKIQNVSNITPPKSQTTTFSNSKSTFNFTTEANLHSDMSKVSDVTTISTKQRATNFLSTKSRQQTMTSEYNHTLFDVKTTRLKTTENNIFESSADDTTTQKPNQTSMDLPTLSDSTVPQTFTSIGVPIISSETAKMSRAASSLNITATDNPTLSEIKIDGTSNTAASLSTQPIQGTMSISDTTVFNDSCTETCTWICANAPGTPTSNSQVKIERKTLSSYKRRHQSAMDPRKSSFYIGCVGITVLVVVVTFIVVLDFVPSA